MKPEWSQYNLWVYSGMLNGLLHNYAQIRLLLEPLMQRFQPKALYALLGSCFFTHCPSSSCVPSYARCVKNSFLSPPPLLWLPPEFASNCSLSGCQENCAVTPGGTACYCKSGYEISSDGKTCKGEFLKQRPPSGPLWYLRLICAANI